MIFTTTLVAVRKLRALFFHRGCFHKSDCCCCFLQVTFSEQPNTERPVGCSLLHRQQLRGAAVPLAPQRHWEPGDRAHAWPPLLGVSGTSGMYPTSSHSTSLSRSLHLSVSQAGGAPPELAGRKVCFIRRHFPITCSSSLLSHTRVWTSSIDIDSNGCHY